MRGAALEAVPRSENCAGDYTWGLDRFIEEAQTLARFNHPNIVRVYRYFRANQTAYMVLHFEEGQNLKGWLKSLGRAQRQKNSTRSSARCCLRSKKSTRRIFSIATSHPTTS